ncbi:MAG: right-handed parallel beta-helix repeat-containing protein [Gemmatimonadetes bacterium]|jgi:hypothetical protein|nr:right-handed parallel beta-helix repeat-containing protein [Gemmatimonadota bacterium]MBT5141718.1 right-handed parallel beta-helix repeat-containing protein [Gemmatimonadota bacterium]MBT5591021.1 right-handed parallel beta-helix repeat-containing protein [Gemmatimonadota bacterium]MBT5962913.1 right-handed parallel beta-helix repeat-containing protein [Gemmatimonadota bacterium]MBT7453803.1 right-handed parallel beta-helix repeat-containing protein [Gemmatimonadota bacterium]
MMAKEILQAATIVALREALTMARQLRAEQPDLAIDIQLQAGIYRLERSLDLDAQDSGTTQAPLQILAADGAEVVFTGSKSLGAVELPGASEDEGHTLGEVSSPDVLERLTSEQKEHLVEISMEAASIPVVDQIEQRGPPPIELFFEGQRLPLSRFPKQDWLRIEDVPQNGPERLHEGLEREKRYHDVPVGRHYGRFVYPGAQPETWGFHEEILVHGYWTWDWSDSVQTVARIDTSQRCVILAAPHHNYGYTTQQRFAFCNVLEEVNAPGSWCFHRRTGRIYLWPPEDSGELPGDLSVSVLREPMIRVRGACHVRIEGIVFRESLGSGVTIEASEDVRVSGCTFTRLGNTAVEVEGTRNRVNSCDFHDLSLGAINVDGGDRATLTPGDTQINNNHIHDFSRWIRTYQYAVGVDGVGQRITHNLVHDAPQEAMRFAGNEHLFEFNEIHSIVKETGDSGAIHTGRDWTWRGTVLRHNLIHGLAGDGLHGAMGIYLDDFMSDTVVEGNIFCHAGRAAFLGGGRDNKVENNLFIACKASVHLDARGTSWAAYYFDGTFPWCFDAMEAMHYDKPPYSEKYPKLLELYDDEPAQPKNNVVRRNVSFGGLWFEFRDQVRITDVTHELNYVADDVLSEQLKQELEVDPYFLNIDGAEPYDRLESAGEPNEAFIKGGNVVAHGAVPVPGWKERNFTVKKDVAEQIGFVQIPFERIGLYLDAWRKDLVEGAKVG